MIRKLSTSLIILIAFCNFSVRFSVYIVCPSVLSLKNLAIGSETGSERHFYTRKLRLRLLTEGLG